MPISSLSKAATKLRLMSGPEKSFDPAGSVKDWVRGLGADLCALTFCESTLDMRVVAAADLVTLGGLRATVESWSQGYPVFTDPKKSVLERAKAATPVGFNIGFLVSNLGGAVQSFAGRALGVSPSFVTGRDAAAEAFIKGIEKSSFAGIQATVVKTGGRVATKGARTLTPGTTSAGQIYVEYARRPAIVAHEARHVEQAINLIAQKKDAVLLQGKILPKIEAEAHRQGFTAALKYESGLTQVKDLYTQSFGYILSKTGLIGPSSAIERLFKK